MNSSLQSVSAVLEEHHNQLEAFGVVQLSVFGSAVRNEATQTSDIDFLVDLHPKTFRNYMGLKLFLEDLFGCPIDLVTRDGLKPPIREAVLGEAKRVA